VGRQDGRVHRVSVSAAARLPGRPGLVLRVRADAQAAQVPVAGGHCDEQGGIRRAAGPEPLPGQLPPRRRALAGEHWRRLEDLDHRRQRDKLQYETGVMQETPFIPVSLGVFYIVSK